MRERSPYQFVVVLFLVVLMTACAASLRDNIRRGALISGAVALSIDQAERELYASGVYYEAKHRQVGAAIVVMLTAVRAFERAVAAWPENISMPQTVPQAMADALAAIGAVEKIVEDVPGNGKLLAHLARARGIIGGKK